MIQHGHFELLLRTFPFSELDPSKFHLVPRRGGKQAQWYQEVNAQLDARSY